MNFAMLKLDNKIKVNRKLIEDRDTDDYFMNYGSYRFSQFRSVDFY